jgi:hypothetical protein
LRGGRFGFTSNEALASVVITGALVDSSAFFVAGLRTRGFGFTVDIGGVSAAITGAALSTAALVPAGTTVVVSAAFLAPDLLRPRRFGFSSGEVLLSAAITGALVDSSVFFAAGLRTRGFGFTVDVAGVSAEIIGAALSTAASVPTGATVVVSAAFLGPDLRPRRFGLSSRGAAVSNGGTVAITSVGVEAATDS